MENNHVKCFLQSVCLFLTQSSYSKLCFGAEAYGGWRKSLWGNFPINTVPPAVHLLREKAELAYCGGWLRDYVINQEDS